ncbi:MAG: response regulator, partial [Planctomycetia bacterium]
VEERIDLLKSNILHYSKDLLQFDVVEIRLLDRQTGRLEPLLAVGMQPEAASMVRACGAESYDVIIADIRLPDMSGYEFLMRLREFRDTVPLVLMTGFGYDPGHSIVKARQAGIDLVLFKPFRIDQLLDTVEKVVARGRGLAAGVATARPL